MALLKHVHDLILAYRLRWKRRRLLVRSWRKRRQLSVVADRTGAVGSDAIKVFLCARNEADRLPYWISYYRSLGVSHFYCVAHASDDGTLDFLVDQPDCSVWKTQASYKSARFGMDWMGHLLRTYGHGSWCLTVDADELLSFPQDDTHDLNDLTRWLDQNRKVALGAPLVDLYPEGGLDQTQYRPGQDPRDILTHYDAWNTTHILQPKHQNQWIQGGPRARYFFEAEPRRAPTLNKIPLVKWDRSYVYVTSTHILLPRKLNSAFDATDGLPIIGCLLHTKFLDIAVRKSSDPTHRAEHFENSDLYDRYYDELQTAPNLWHANARTYRGWRGLEEDGILWCRIWRNNDS